MKKKCVFALVLALAALVEGASITIITDAGSGRKLASFCELTR